MDRQLKLLKITLFHVQPCYLLVEGENFALAFAGGGTGVQGVGTSVEGICSYR